MNFILREVRPFYKKNFAFKFAKRRFFFINKLSGNFLLSPHQKPIKILEVGCHTGEDFIRHLKDRNDVELYGIDLKDFGLRQSNFEMIVGDAEKIEFPDNFFDITVSLGVLEHIQPIEKLSKVISEINRVSKSYYIDVPAISTFVESHTDSILWQLRDNNKKVFSYKGGLNFFSDEAWLQFLGFHSAKVCRFAYIPFLMTSLFIYKKM